MPIILWLLGVPITLILALLLLGVVCNRLSKPSTGRRAKPPQRVHRLRQARIERGRAAEIGDGGAPGAELFAGSVRAG